VSFKVYVNRLISQSKESLLNIDLIFEDNNDLCVLLKGSDHNSRSYPINVTKFVSSEDEALSHCKKVINDCRKYIQNFSYRHDFPNPGGSGKDVLFFDDLFSLQMDYLLAPLVDQKHNKERIYDRLSEYDYTSLLNILSISDEHRRWEEPKQTTNDKLSVIYANNSLFGRF